MPLRVPTDKSIFQNSQISNSDDVARSSNMDLKAQEQPSRIKQPASRKQSVEQGLFAEHLL
jgi:hypothetical protein